MRLDEIKARAELVAGKPDNCEPTEKPLTRPDEPPVGSLFRVERTGTTYYRWSHLIDSFNPYVSVEGSPCWSFWTAITEPGDTITLLDLVERES